MSPSKNSAALLATVAGLLYWGSIGSAEARVPNFHLRNAFGYRLKAGKGTQAYGDAYTSVNPPHIRKGQPLKRQWDLYGAYCGDEVASNWRAICAAMEQTGIKPGHRLTGWLIQLKYTMAKNGWLPLKPVKIDRRGVIFDGHHTFAAAWALAILDGHAPPRLEPAEVNSPYPPIESWRAVGVD
ncbi:MAG: hypothetical protein H6707_13130 [Deltaproteobacteria bacterium]|nr:hypothetical protein [Deltaproteobacteria bacterium]